VAATPATDDADVEEPEEADEAVTELEESEV
jgi:hypothetical protein